MHRVGEEMVQLILKDMREENWFVPIMVGGVDMAKEKNFILKGGPGLSEEELGSYVAGLMEGDGSIWIQREVKGKRHNPRFTITFNRRDLPLCKKLLELLGEGKGRIGYNKGDNACDLLISSVKGLERVVGLIKGKMRTPKIYRMWGLIDWLNKNHGKSIKKEEVLRGGMGEDNWLSGFIEADGSFYVGIEEGRRKVRCNMTIEQKQEEKMTKESYSEVMREIGGFMGVELREREQKESGRKYYRLRVERKEGVEKLIDYLEKRRLYSLKYRDYEDWKKVIEMKRRGEHKGEEGWREVKRRKGGMNMKRVEGRWDHLEGLTLLKDE